MTTLDEIVANKLMDLVNYMLSKIIKPDITVDKVTQLNEEEIEKIKQKYGIEGILLDVDDTLRKNMKSIPKANKDWIESLRGKIKIIIVSNGKDKDIEKYFKEKDIDYIGFAHKPLKRNFLKEKKKMNLTPDKVLAVGDSLFDDIYGGKRNNMKTALVKEVEDDGR